MITNKTTYLILILLVIVFTGCSTDLQLGNYMDKTTPFQLTINQTDLSTGLTTGKMEELKVNSVKWSKIIEWGEKNKENWQSSIASHIGDVYLIQGDFRLIYTNGSNRVVIGFIDKQGKAKQYTKEITKGELDFLTIIDNNKQSNSDTLQDNCEKCKIQTVKKVYNNIEDLSYGVISEFLCAIDKTCKNNVEFSEWSNEMLFKIIEKNPTLYFRVLKELKKEKQKYILSKFENPIIDIDYKKIYNNIEKLNLEKEMKIEYLNSLKIIAKKYNSEIKN